MSIRRESPYGPFVEHVLLPAIRIGVLALSILAIGFGSWFETNETINDCTFKSTMSMHQVFLYRNITSNLTTPDSVSFGLWKHCYIYALNCSCSPTNLRYQPDVSTVLQVATQHNATAPITAPTSLSRIIPLLLATVFGGIAFLLGLYSNKGGKYLYRRIVVGFVLATSILVAYTFGSSYQHYYQMIKETCQDTSNKVHCARHVVQAESILFAVALGLLFLSLLFWTIASAFFTKSANDKPAFMSQTHQRNYSPTTSDYTPSKTTTAYSSQDELAVWRDVAMFDRDNIIWEEDKRNLYHHQNGSKGSSSTDTAEYYKKPTKRYYSPVEKSLSPPPASAGKSSRRDSPSNSHGYHRQQKRRSSNNANYQQQQQQQQHRMGKRHDQKYNHRQQSRKESQDSTMTFGGYKSRKPSQGYSDWEQRYQTSRLSMGGGGGAMKTPTSMSPHPFQYPTDASNARNSFCMTPNFDDQPSEPSSNSYFPQQEHRKSSTSSLGYVPILNMPPSGTPESTIEHPLNKKVITDKRIQEYLQNSRPY
ncbi:hypothetical protein BCV72DRAFT_258727 [Rhizopus microsporus var. microsporus]|uniref:Uncharacterized protein n=1 Tax=Rhizopus microsporus var. microsporus TaxID=86635 RepID=A0A1X0QP80_RHIZD|nr:hypothetical protein BCV72DRAFT_258727 [Rhizopus microsporus var. microsporus]